MGLDFEWILETKMFSLQKFGGPIAHPIFKSVGLFV